MRADPKPTPRVKLSAREYAALAAELKQRWPRCACGCKRWADSIHHVIGGAGRSDIYANMIPLAGDGARGCHGALTSRQRVWDEGRLTYIEPLWVAVGIRRHLEEHRHDVLAYVLAAKGQDWLDRRYPFVPR